MDRAPIVLPIRFATRNAAVQTTTRELALTGVFVRCLESPPEGTAIEMRLHLPGDRAPLEVNGEVREVAPASDEAGFWAEFVGLSEAGKAQIAEVLSRPKEAGSLAEGTPPAQPQQDGRRAFPRHTARFAVRFATVQDFVLEYAANISAGGVFVETRSPPPMKTIVRVEMELPGSGAPVPARGIVVHRITPEEAQARGTAPGVGVQFLDADDRFRERIDAAIDSILKS